MYGLYFRVYGLMVRVYGLMFKAPAFFRLCTCANCDFSAL